MDARHLVLSPGSETLNQAPAPSFVAQSYFLPYLPMHTCTYPPTHACMHPPTYTRMHAPTHPCIHAHMHARTQSPSSLLCWVRLSWDSVSGLFPTDVWSLLTWVSHPLSSGPGDSNLSFPVSLCAYTWLYTLPNLRTFISDILMAFGFPRD